MSYRLFYLSVVNNHLYHLWVRDLFVFFLQRNIFHILFLWMIMMSGFAERIINSPQTCYQSAEQVRLQMLSERRSRESCRSQSS